MPDATKVGERSPGEALILPSRNIACQLEEMIGILVRGYELATHVETLQQASFHSCAMQALLGNPVLLGLLLYGTSSV